MFRRSYPLKIDPLKKNKGVQQDKPTNIMTTTIQARLRHTEIKENKRDKTYQFSNILEE